MLSLYRSLHSFGVFRAFAQAYGRVVSHDTIRFRIQSATDASALTNLIDYMDRPITKTRLDFQWTTVLTLNLMEGFLSTTLLNLSQLPNIGALKIYHPKAADPAPWTYAAEDYVTDRLIRAWADAAREAGAFQMLKTLVCINQPLLTPDALEHLSALPKLETFATNNLSIENEARNHPDVRGWICQPNAQWPQYVPSTPSLRVDVGRLGLPRGGPWKLFVRGPKLHASNRVEAMSNPGRDTPNSSQKEIKATHSQDVRSSLADLGL